MQHTHTHTLWFDVLFQHQGGTCMTCLWHFTLPRNYQLSFEIYIISIHHIWTDSETTRDFDTLRAEAEAPISEVRKAWTGPSCFSGYPGSRKTCSIRKTRLSQVQIQEEGNISQKIHTVPIKQHADNPCDILQIHTAHQNIISVLLRPIGSSGNEPRKMCLHCFLRPRKSGCTLNSPSILISIVIYKYQI